MRKHRSSPFLAYGVMCGVALALTVSCNRQTAPSPKRIAQGFCESLIKGDFAAASMHVADEDSTVFYEGWRVIRERMARIGDPRIDVKIDGSGVTGSVSLSGQGETISFLLRKQNGEWWVHAQQTIEDLSASAPVPPAEEAPAPAEDGEAAAPGS